MSAEAPYNTRESMEKMHHLPEQMDDDDDIDEFFDDISESLECMVPLRGVNLVSPRGEGPGNLSVLSNDDSDFAGISPGAGLPSTTSSEKTHGYTHTHHNQKHGRGPYFLRNSGDKTPMATNRSSRLESDVQIFQDEEKGVVDTMENGGPNLFPSRLPVYGDSSEDEGASTIQDEEGSESLREHETPPPSPHHKVPTSSSSLKNSTPSHRKSRNSATADDSDATRRPITPRLSQQQEMQRQHLHHLMMTPIGPQLAEEFAQNEQSAENLSHLMMTQTMNRTYDVGFRPSFPLRSPAATSTSLSYSTDPSRENNRSGNPDPESSVSFASPVNGNSQQRPPNQPQIDSVGRLSSHTGESANSQSGVTTIQSEATRYHSGVERDFRKEGFWKNHLHTNRDAEEVDAPSSDGSESTLEPLVVCGITCSMCFTRLVDNPCSLYRISLCIVEYAPCFWFWCCRRTDLQGNASSDRFILARMNTISFFFTMMQLVAASWLATVLFWITGDGVTGSFSPHLWNCNGAVFSLGLIGAGIMIMCFCTVRIIKEVDLIGAIRYLWALLWIFPVEIFFNITLFDYHRVTEVWIVHWWGVKQLSWFRDKYCTEGTSDTLCLVPINGGPDYATEDDWCEAMYNSTDCTDIRDDAQKATTFWLLIFYTSLATWGCMFMFLMLLVINTLERIISKPIVQKSRETNVPGWLTFPTIGTALVGTIFLFSQSSLLRTLKENKWVGIMYTVTSGLFLIALLMGCCLSSYSVRSNVDKRRKSTAVIVFIGVLAVNVSLLATLFVTSIAWSTQVDLNGSQRGDIACLINDNDCTNCDAVLSTEKCPEWSVADVTAIVQTQLKQSASLAAIFILYAVNVMGYGINLRRHLSRYQIDYV